MHFWHRHPQSLHGLALGLHAAPVIPFHYVGRGMSRDIGDGHHIHPGV
jgi:hypothetical protein